MVQVAASGEGSFSTAAAAKLSADVSLRKGFKDKISSKTLNVLPSKKSH